MYMNIDLEYLCMCILEHTQAAKHYFFTEGKLSRAILLEYVAGDWRRAD